MRIVPSGIGRKTGRLCTGVFRTTQLRYRRAMKCRFYNAKPPALCLGLLLPIAACADDPTYFRDIKPIVDKRCVVCHNAASKDDHESSGGLSLETADDLVKSANASLVVSGRPGKSELYRRIVHSESAKRMPKDDGPLSDDEARTIRRWIETGAKIGTPTPTRAALRRVRRTASAPVSFTFESIVPKQSPTGLPAGKLSLIAAVGPMPPITALAHSPDGKFLAVGSRERVAIWNLKTGRFETSLGDRFPDVLALAFSPDSNRLWIAGGEPAVRGVVRAIEVGSWKRTFDWHAGRDVVAGLALDHNGARAAFVGYDRMLRIVDVKTGEMLHESKAHGDTVTCVAYSPDGQLLATGGKDATIKLWDAKTAKPIRSFSGHSKDVLAVTFAPTGKQIFSTGLEPEIRIWEVSRVGKPVIQSGPGGATYQFAWDPQRRRLATVGSDQIVRLWPAEPKAPTRLRTTSEVLYAASFGINGKTIVAGGWDGVVRIWSVASGKVVASLIAVDGAEAGTTDWLAFGEPAIVCSSPRMRSRVTLESGKSIVPLERHAARLDHPGALAAHLAGQSNPTMASSE